MWQALERGMRAAFSTRTKIIEPSSSFLAFSAFDRILLHEFTERDKGVIVFRGDSRPPEEIFKNGFEFTLDAQRAYDLCCTLSSGGSPPIATHSLIAGASAYLPVNLY